MLKRNLFLLVLLFFGAAEPLHAQNPGGMCLNCFLTGPSQEAYDWLPFITVSYRGIQAHTGEDHSNKLGFDLGISSPWLRGIDLAAGFSEMFREGGVLHKDIRARIYFSSFRSGFYVGGGYFYEPVELGYATLGLGARNIYLEVDLIEGTRRPVTAIGEFGFRVFFD